MKEPIKIGLLTEKEYSWLKSSKDRTTEENQKIKQYEKNVSKIKDQDNNLDAPMSKRSKITITSAMLWKYFKIFYSYVNGKEFMETPDSKKNVGVLLSYFSKDEKFFESERLIRGMNQPSFDKSLLIVGFYGNGKTTIIRAFCKMFDHYQMPMRFKMVNAHDLVSEWESLETNGAKDLFFEKYLCRNLAIDDAKKEDKASNYGLKEIVGKILEKRYDRKLGTIITCNYREGDSKGDLADAINEFNRYGNHIVDRIYETHNIIEFKGKSFR